jgi:hypothetical protein
VVSGGLRERDEQAEEHGGSPTPSVTTNAFLLTYSRLVGPHIRDIANSLEMAMLNG